MKDITYRCWAASDRGLVRAHNEDGCAVAGLAGEVRPASWAGNLPPKGWAIVADGMGGHAGGEVASTVSIECLRTLSDMLFSPEELATAIAATHDALFNIMAEDDFVEGMGTTLAGVSFSEEQALVFNVGDSRIYLMETSLEQVSEDHVVGGNMLTRCLGGATRTPPIPHVTRTPVEIGATLLLCSDGLTDMVSDQEIEKVLKSKPENPATSLVRAALAAGGHDNVTVVVIQRTE
jgi:PPM family protein phosphatase